MSEVDAVPAGETASCPSVCSCNDRFREDQQEWTAPIVANTPASLDADPRSRAPGRAHPCRYERRAGAVSARSFLSGFGVRRSGDWRGSTT